MLAETEAFGRTALPGELRRSPAELGSLIERGAGDVDPWSADYSWIEQLRSPLPILKMYYMLPAPTASSYRWPDLVPISLLDDAVAFELGRSRSIRRGLPRTFGFSLQLSDQEFTSTQRLSHQILVGLLGEESGWTTLVWWDGYLGSLFVLEPETALQKFRRDFGPDHPFTAVVANNFGVSIQSRNAQRNAPFPPPTPRPEPD